MSYLKSVFSLTVLIFLSLNLSAQLADFDEGCAPMTVNFTAPGGSASFFWTFGNSTTSTDANPSQIYTTPGSYPITFSLTPGGAVIATDTIFVYEKPTASFEADTLVGCVPFDVNFSSTSVIDPNIEVSGFNWAFGDGLSGTGANTSHTYNVGGNYKVGLVITSPMPGCRSAVDIDDYIFVNPAPPSQFSASVTSACDPPLNVTFTNNTPNDPNYSYSWDFGNTQTSTERNPGTITYDAAGTFEATLTVTDNIGCSKDSTIIINIGSPSIDIIIGDTICASPIPLAVRNGSSNGDYFWEFSSPAVPSFSTLRQPFVRFPDEGNYDITLTVTDPSGACTSTETITVYAEVPSTDFTIDPSYACDYPVDLTFTPTGSDIISLNWIIIDTVAPVVVRTTDSIATYQIPRDTSTYGLNDLREIEVTLIAINSRGCTALETKKDTFFAPNARFNTDTIMGCAPLEVTFYDSMSVSNEAITTYIYEWGDGSPNSTFTSNDSTTHTFMQAGEYDVVLYIENEVGCIDTSYAVRIFVGAPVTADFSVDQTNICPGESVQFMGVGDTTLIDSWHFETEGSRMSHCADDRNPTWGFESITGSMDATMTVIYNGCATTVEKTDLITVRGPIAQLDYVNDCDNKFEVVFADSSHDASTISWDFGDGSAPNTMNDPSHVYAQTGDYEVVLTASNPSTGCPESRDTTMVHIRDLQAGFSLEDNYCQGEMIMLDATMSTDVNATCWKGYTWFPSDSRPITTQDSIIDYAWTGIDTQTLELIVQDINGCQDTLRDTTIVWQVTAEAEADPLRLCAPNDVQFTDLSTGNGTIVRWEWDFGDSGSSTDKNPLHTYTVTPPLDPNTGDTTYTVELIAFDSLECSDTIQFIVDFYDPISEILLSDDGVCVGDEITYSATDFTSEGSSLTYEWFLNDNPIGTAQSGSIILDMVGDQTLRLDFTEIATGCKRSTDVIINVQGFPDPAFTAPIDGNTINCAGQNIDFTATASSDPNLGFTWNMGDGTVIPASNNSGVIQYPYGRGTFITTLFVETTNGCRDSSNREYTFVAPEGFLTADKLKICPGEEITFGIRDTMDVSSWEIVIGAVIFENEDPVTFQFNDPGIIPVVLKTQLDVDGLECVTDDILEIEVIDLAVDFTTDQPAYCPGDVVQFTSITTSATDELSWDFGDGSPASSDLNPTHVYSNVGGYDVTLTVQNNELNCSNSITKTIDVNGDLNLEITPDQQICLDDSAMLAVLNSQQDNWIYSWEPDLQTDSAISVSPVTSTRYTVTVINTLTNCRDTASTFVEVSRRPDIENSNVSIMVKYTPEGATFDPVALPPLPDGAEGLSITWEPEDNLDLSDPVRPILTGINTLNPSDSLRYRAVIIHQCGRDTLYRKINVFKVPNIFSPGTDDINDNFNIFFTNSNEPVNAEDIVSFKIYNRWGQQVYNNETPITGWNGDYENEPQISDVYVFKIEVLLPDGTIGSCEGDVTLFR